jgi:hypothetical protein
MRARAAGKASRDDVLRVVEPWKEQSRDPDIWWRSPTIMAAVAARNMARFVCWHIQEQAFGELDPETAKVLDRYAKGNRQPARRLKAGTVLVREYQGERHTITVVPGGYVWRETAYTSLSTIARAITGTAWNVSGPLAARLN